MLSETTTPALIEQAISEIECLTLSLYTPISREQWERSQAIADRLLDYVFGA